MRLFLTLSTIAAIASPAYAAPLSLNLTLTVPVRCTIISMEAIDLAVGHIRVNTACNASSFGVILGGDLQDRAISHATTHNARVSVRHNSLIVSPNGPGAYSFDVHYQGSVADVKNIKAEIQAL